MQATSIYLNDFQIHSIASDVGFVVNQDIDGFEFPEIRFSSYPKPGQHGAIVPNVFYDGRPITIPGRVSGRTTAEYATNKRNFFNLLRIVENSLNIANPLVLKWTTIDSLSLQINCYPAQRPKFKESSLNHGNFLLNLFSDDYNIYEQSVQTKTINISSGGGLLYPAIYPVIYPANTGGTAVVTNGGNSDTFLKVTFYGPLTSPYIKNLTTGAQFQINYTLSSIDTLVVDMMNQAMSLNDTTNAMQYFNYLNTWMTLQPGDNTINFGSGLSSDSGHVVLSYQNAWISS